MARRVLTFGSTSLTPFTGSGNGTDVTTNYTITNNLTNRTGALNDEASRPTRITSLRVYWQPTSAGSVDLQVGTGARAGGAVSWVGNPVNTTGSSSVGSPNLPYMTQTTIYYGFQKNDASTVRFYRGASSGQYIYFNGVEEGIWTGQNALHADLTIDSAPSAPTGINGATVSPTSIIVGWAAPSDNGGVAINGYRVAYRVSGGSWQFWSTYSSSATSATITGLDPATTYEVAVAATNAVTSLFNSSYTSVNAHTGSNAKVFVTTEEDVQPALGDIQATAIDQTSIQVEWSTTNSPTSTRVSGPGMTTRFTSSGNITATGLQPNTTYTYTIETYNSANVDNPDVTTSSARTLLPAPTLTITAEALTSTTARVIWESSEATSVSITGTNLSSTELSGNEIVTGLTRNTIYRWQGTASNNDGSTGTVRSNSIQTPNVIGGVWTGTQWAFPTVRVWTGSSWAVKEAKVWTGSQWKVWA